MQRHLKRLRTVFLVLLALLVLMLLIIQTQLFKDLLRNIIVKEVNKTLNEAELSLNSIEGNYFNSLTLRGIRLRQDGKDILSLGEISLHYTLSKLLHHKIDIHQVFIDELNLALKQDYNKQWNLQTIFPPSENKKQKQVKPFNWQISIEEFTLLNSSANINTQETNSYIPQNFSNLNINLKASYSEKRSYLHLNHLNFNTEDPDLSIENITFYAEILDNIAYLDTLEIKTSQNLICTSAELNIKSKELSNFIFDIDPLNLDEFQAFIPKNNFKMLPEAYIHLNLEKQKACLDLMMEHSDQKLVLSLKADSIFSIPIYDLELELAHLNGDTWLADEKLDSDINLLLSVFGKGIKPQQAEGNINLKISPSRLDKRTLDSMQLLVNKTGSTADLSTQISGSFGKINIIGNVNNIFDQINYQVHGKLEHCNLATILENDSLASDLNLNFSLNGTGTDPKTLTADILINSAPSNIMDIELDKVMADIHYDSEDYIIRNMELNNTLGKIDLTGEGNFAGNHNFNFEFITGDMLPLKNLIKAKELDLEGNIKGKITIHDNDIEATLGIDFADLKYNDYSFEKLEVTMVANRQDNLLSGDVSLNISELDNGKFPIHTVKLHTFGNEKRLQNILDIEADSLNIHCSANVLQDSIISIELQELNTKYGSLLIENEHSEARILIGKNSYQINDLDLKHKDGLIKIAGILTLNGEQDFSLVIENLAIDQLHNSGLINRDVHGRLNFNAQLKSTFKQPELKIDMNLEDAGYDKIMLGDLEFSANLADNEFVSLYSLTRNDMENISGSAKFPVYLDTMQSKEIIPEDEQIYVSIYINNQDIGILKASLPQVKKLEGLFNADIQLGNTLENPQLSGNVTLTKGKLSVPAWGINYPELRLNTSINNDNIDFKELYIKGGEGSLIVSGKTDLEKPIQRGIKNINLKVLANRFIATDKQGIFLLMNSEIRLEGKPHNLKYGGSLDIPKAVLDLDKLPGRKKTSVDINSPLLIIASQKIEDANLKSDDKKPKTQSDIIRNLTGELQINIPKNTWIRNKDMNIEIAGHLKIIKKARDFEIFGYVKTIRGKYEMYGKKFDLQEGTLTFNGGTQPDPNLDLNAQYVFRDINKDKRKLTFKVTGHSMKPDVKFILDDEEISETDAISYILFGRSSSEISHDQKSEVNSQTESGIALSFLSKQIGNKIANQIGKTLNLDVVEFSGGSNWKQASMVVGKYITNDLYINYKKEFSLDQSKEIVPDEVSLEYEINRYFSVQATRGNEKSTGVDLFWKFEVE